jgi:hypothetical protein
MPFNKPPSGDLVSRYRRGEHILAFVDYLRLCFRWAGFPRLERYVERADVVAFVAEMTKGVEPF